MIKRLVAHIALVALCNSYAHGGDARPFAADRVFIENKGQIGDQFGRPNKDVRFLIVRLGLNIQLKANSFSYDTYVFDRCELTPADKDRMVPPSHHERPAEEITFQFHRVDVELVGANPSPTIVTSQQSADYLNYYTHITEQVNGEQGATFVRGYGRVQYRDVWPGIDLEWFIDEDGNPEYQFMVRPGGDPRQIQLRYHGANATELLAESIMIHVKHGPLRERIPKSFYDGTGQLVNVRYRKLGDNTYGVEVPSTDMAITETLVIDPTPERLWGTYYGGSGGECYEANAIYNWYDYGNLVVTGNWFILCGSSNSLANIATTNSYQSTVLGNGDAFIGKFSIATSIRSWGTYFGGGNNHAYPNVSSSSEICRSVAVATDGAIVATGITTSRDGISTANAHQRYHSTHFNSNGDDGDAFIAKFDSSGVRRWSTYYGGFGYETGNCIAIDGLDNIYLGGYSSSLNTSAIATPGAYDTYGPGGYIVKFSSTGVRQWGTYLSSSVINGITTIGTSSLAVIGYRENVGFATNGVHQPTHGGDVTDGMIAKFDVDGKLKWWTYYGGESTDYLWAVDYDGAERLVVGGSTRNSKTGIASAGADKFNFGGFLSEGEEGILAVFDTLGNRKWGTYVGGNSSEGVRDVAIAKDGIFLVGETYSSVGIATTDAYDKSLGGRIDAYFAKYELQGRRLWGAYYGGDTNDYGRSVAVLEDGGFIVSGWTYSSNSIATPGSQQASYGGGGDTWVARFSECNPPIVTSLNFTGIYCLGSIITASVRIPIGASVRWTAPKLGVVTAGNLRDSSVTIRWTNSGVDTLRLRVMNSTDTTCYRDTTIIVTVSPLPTPVINGSAAVCTQDIRSYRVTVAPGRTYSWKVPALGTLQSGATGDSVVVRWTKTGTDTIRIRETITATGCAKDTFLIVTVNPLPMPQISGSLVVCETAQSVYRVPKQAGRAYSWSSPRLGSILGSSANDSAVVVWDKARGGDVDTIKVRETVLATGCSADATLSVQIEALPRPSITGPTATCSGSESVYATDPSMRALWTLPNEAFMIGGTSASSSIRLRWQKPGRFVVALRSTNPLSGCVSDTSLQVTVGNTPMTDINGPQSLCISDSKSKRYSVAQGDSGTQFFWTVSPSTFGSILRGQATNQIDVDWLRRGTASLRLRAIGPNGCERDSTITITIADSLNPFITSASGYSMCQGDSVQLDAGSGYTAYAWYEAGQQVGGSRYFVTRRAAEYFVRVSDGSCAGASSSVTTVVNPPPTAEVKESQPGVLSASTDAQTAAYQWYDASTTSWSVISGETQQTYVPSASGTFGVEIVNSATACRNRSLSYTITIGPPSTEPVVTALTPAISVCSGEQATLRIRVSGGRQPYSFSWTDGSTALPVADTVAAFIPNASMTVTCVVADADGRRDTAIMTVDVKPYPVAKITESPRGTLQAEPLGADRYQWMTSSGTTLVGANNATYVPSVSGRYSVEVTQANCRDTSDEFVYEAPPVARLEVGDHNFGTVPVDDLINSSGGHAGSVRVRNMTGQPLELTGATAEDSSAFVVPQQWPRRMNDGDTAQVVVRFLPIQRQTYNSAINVQTSTAYTGGGILTGTGRDLLPDERVTQIVLSPVRREIEPGDTISVLLVASVERPQFSAGAAGRFMTTIQWDSRVLEPISSPGLFYDTTGTYGIATVLNGYRQQNQRELYRFRFRAKQAEVDTTSIIFSGAKGFIWMDDRKAYPALLDSVVRVRVCTDGGPQLIGRIVKSRLVSMSPNPASDYIDVMFNIVSDSRLRIVNSIGNVMIDLALSATDQVTSRTIDVSQFPSGSYQVILSAHGDVQNALLVVTQ